MIYSPQFDRAVRLHNAARVNGSHEINKIAPGRGAYYVTRRDVFLWGPMLLDGEVSLEGSRKIVMRAAQS